jgi:hypothetical protein
VTFVNFRHFFDVFLFFDGGKERFVGWNELNFLLQNSCPVPDDEAKELALPSREGLRNRVASLLTENRRLKELLKASGICFDEGFGNDE